MPKDRQTCFVIMPFSDTTEDHTEKYWTEHFSTFLRPLIENDSPFEARRSEPLRGDILKQIVTDLVVSPVVVADLTDSNPNVYWELGVRQSFKHCTVTIAQLGTRLPFDVGGKATLFYDPKDHLQIESFRKPFCKAIQDCIKHPERPDSHVLETISGRGTLFQIFRRDEAMRRLDALLSECNENLQVLVVVTKNARANQSDPTKRTTSTRRFRLSATDLLISTRYLDEQKSFFKLAETQSNRLLALNGQLALWEHSPNETEKWLLQHEASCSSTFETFTQRVNQARQTLSMRK